MKIVKQHEIEITDEEMFDLIKHWSHDNLQVLIKICNHRLKGEAINCPFPFQCNEFPCDSLQCNTDELNNGRAFRRS